jgi:hypothetical protein
MRFCLFAFACVLVSCSGGGNQPPLAGTGDPSAAPQAVVTRSYDNSRSGVNPNETQLTPDNVNAARFGKLFSYDVDGHIYGEPLYVPAVNVPGKGTHNVIYVATQNDSLYAFDADQNLGGPLWKASLVDSANGETSIPCADVSGCSVAATIGVTATPVISLERNAIYVEARSKQNTSYFHKLHALDLATGKEKFGGPVVIQASVPGTALDADAQGNVNFNNLRENDRGALLLVNGVVYMAFASIDDVGPYHGWVLAYNADTLQQVAAFNDTPNGTQGGIFATNGPAADAAGNVYVVSGNGSPPPSAGNFSQSFVKLSRQLAVMDFFAPFNSATLNLTNVDVGSGGILLLPDQPGTAHPHLLVAAGKEGKIYLIDRENLGKFNSQADQVVQSVPNAIGTGDDSDFYSPVFWNGKVYFSGTDDVVKAFSFNNGLLSTTPVMQAATTFTFPGGGLILSANGNTAGILWALEWHVATHLGTLHAYDAQDLTHELWNSDQSGTRDSAGITTRLNVPLEINGKVYVSGKGTLIVYGLLP